RRSGNHPAKRSSPSEAIARLERQIPVRVDKDVLIAGAEEGKREGKSELCRIVVAQRSRRTRGCRGGIVTGRGNPNLILARVAAGERELNGLRAKIERIAPADYATRVFENGDIAVVGKNPRRGHSGSRSLEPRPRLPMEMHLFPRTVAIRSADSPVQPRKGRQYR